MLDHATVANLNALKLLGFAEGLQEQMNRPELLTLSFEERLALLVDRELNLRSDRKRARLLQQANLKYPGASIEDAGFNRGGPGNLNRGISGMSAAFQGIIALVQGAEYGTEIPSKPLAGIQGARRAGGPARRKDHR